MNYYSHHIGDFDRKTRHLTRIERSVYRDLIELYYDTEEQLMLDVPKLCRKIIARTEEESTSVQQVLNEFFTKTPTGWYHDRCEEELDNYRNSTSQKSLAGKASAAKKAIKKQQALNGNSTSVEQTSNGTSTNQEPLTINHKPVKTKTDPPAASASPKYSALDDLIARGVDKKVAADWLLVRKLKKSAPTQTAIEGVLDALAASGYSADAGVRLCCLRSWAGFNQKWLDNEQAQARVLPRQSKNDRAGAAAAVFGAQQETEGLIDVN